MRYRLCLMPSNFLHLLEEMDILPADRERFRPAFEPDNPSAGHRTAYLINALYIDNRSPVDAPELLGVQFIGQFFDRLLDERFTLLRYDHGVFIAGLEVVNLFYGNEPDTIPLLDSNKL
jgi:hypothetical protein